MIGQWQYFFVQKPIITKDAIGGMIKTWKTIDRVKGRFVSYSRDARNAESLLYSKDTIDANNFILFDYSINLRASDRLIHNSRTFDVIYIEDINMANMVKKVSVKEVYDGQV